MYFVKYMSVSKESRSFSSFTFYWIKCFILRHCMLRNYIELQLFHILKKPCTPSVTLFKNCIKHTNRLSYILVSKAMLKKPVVTEVRTPTNTWSGLGFSKSMPAETIKELRRANHVSYKPTMTTAYEVHSSPPVYLFHRRTAGSLLSLPLYGHRDGVAWLPFSLWACVKWMSFHIRFLSSPLNIIHLYIWWEFIFWE